MSMPNPPMRRHFHSRRRDESCWLDFFMTALSVSGDRITGKIVYVEDAANSADKAFAEYRKRFPAPEVELEGANPASESEGARPQ